VVADGTAAVVAVGAVRATELALLVDP
jgi:hypothetical protein